MGTMKISVFTYQHGEVCELTIEKFIGSSMESVEDLIMDICRERDIGPISCYLFSLYSPKSNVWLSMNQKLNELDAIHKSLELRIRFKPYDLRKLIICDENTFNYYYCQVRHTFRNSRIEDTGKLFGLVITDLLVYSQERNIPVGNALDHVKSLRDFVPIPYKAESKLLKDLKGSQIIQSLCEASCQVSTSNDGLGRSHFVRKEFINEIVNYETTIIKGLGHETFTIYKTSRFEKANGMPGTNEFLLQVRPFGSVEIFTAHKSSTPDWNYLCSVAEICFIIIQDDSGIEISRKNGTQVFFTVPDPWIRKSLLSLLEGYHRLITGDSICICDYVIPPSIQQFKDIRCHGPMTTRESKAIFTEKRSPGNYFIRLDPNRYLYIMDIWIGGGITSLFIEKKGGKLMVYKDNQLLASFPSFSVLKRELKVTGNNGDEKIGLKLCIPPLGSTTLNWIIQCRDTSKPKTVESLATISVELNFSHFFILENQLFKDKSFRYYSVLHKGEHLLCKVPSSTQERLIPFLDKLNSWSSLTSNLVARTRFITLSPPAFVRDYLPLGSLDEYLRSNHSEVHIYELIECAMYLSRALCYLHEKSIAHGMIRCCALLVVEKSSRRFQVKLGDPFLHLDENVDRLWIPKEYSAHSTTIPLSVDIFASATTLWEIFSLGQRPPGADVYSLPRPLPCPSAIWSLMLKCWQPDPEQRKHPMEMHRDIRELFIREYHSRTFSGSTSNYTYINEGTERKKVSSLTRFLNKLSGTNYEGSSEYDYKLEEEEEEDESEDDYSINYNCDSESSWIIPVNHLKISTFKGREAILGSGAYGEVLKANYPADSDNLVAVKRINRRAKQRNGDQIIADVEREFKIMTKVYHPNIVSIRGIVKDPEIMLVMEYMELGSLARFLRKLEPSSVRSTSFSKFALDIASGMEYLEEQRIVHRDLAARNILMASLDQVKISDFGLAQSLGPGEEVYFVRTPRYLPFKWYAPESIRNDPIFTSKSDVWSFGVTLWEIFSLGSIPDYPITNKNSTVELLRYLDSGGTLSKPEKQVPGIQQFWPLILKCWQVDESKRPNFTQLKVEINKICTQSPFPST